MRKLILLILVLIVTSCSNKKSLKTKIDGLWLVKKVKVGQEEMTPVARWMQFNKDSSQTSGNGWLQHSFGTWSFNNKELIVKNTNGVEDNLNPFVVNLENSKMTWSRVEEGENVQVFLERTNKIPTSDGNRLMGLWELNSIVSDNQDKNFILQHTQTLFLRWDNTYVDYKEGRGKRYGIYKIHGHKPELQMVNYGDKPEFKFYKFSIIDDELTLTATKGKEQLIYSRIH
ncbi:MAG: hypothetical protein AB8B78_11120 [Polaribacter sp.]